VILAGPEQGDRPAGTGGGTVASSGGPRVPEQPAEVDLVAEETEPVQEH
jgi:hypothetical protein